MNPFSLGLAAAAATLLAVSGSPETATPGAPDSRTAGRPAPTSVAQWPVRSATVERAFDPHEQFGPGHRGTDLSAWPGQSVRSALPGEVTFAGLVAGRGVVVVGHRDDLRTSYLPVQPGVAPGDQVEAGDRLGRLAPIAHCPTTFCLHWGARRGETYVDPLTLLPGRVVLLPP
jgi:murein DD-endopeptidase MepM/ murein hydrolase activator NlpD